LFDGISSHSNIAFVVYCYGKYKAIKDDIIYNFQRYADKYKYDLIISEQENIQKHTWVKLQSFELLSEYKWVITCDMDMYISPSCPDIINFCTINSFNQLINANIATSCLFVIDKSFQKYNYSNYKDLIHSLIKDTCIECMPECLIYNHTNIVDEECWLTRLIYKNKINFNNIRISAYTTNKYNMLLPRDCYRYNIIHFNNYSNNNMVRCLPELYYQLDKRTNVSQMNKYILQQWYSTKY